MYESYLSDLLNCPLLTTLSAPMKLGDIKELWNKYEIPTTNSVVIEPNTTFQNVIEILADLISDNLFTKIWVLKMNGEFNGRGIATFDVASCKKIKDILN